MVPVKRAIMQLMSYREITHTLCMEKTNNCHWLKRNYTIIININWPLMQVSLMTVFLENTKSMPMPAIISLNYLYRVTIPLMRVKESMAN